MGAANPRQDEQKVTNKRRVTRIKGESNELYAYMHLDGAQPRPMGWAWARGVKKKGKGTDPKKPPFFQVFSIFSFFFPFPQKSLNDSKSFSQDAFFIFIDVLFCANSPSISA